LNQIRSQLPSSGNVPAVPPYVNIDVVAQTVLVNFFSSQWLNSCYVSFEAKKTGLTILSDLTFMDTWIATFPEAWLCVKEFLFENCPSDEPEILLLCNDCLWVLSNVAGDCIELRLELASSTQFRAILCFMLSYGLGKPDLKQEIALTISVVCQSVSRSKEDRIMAAPETARYFAATVLHILEYFDRNLRDLIIENCFNTLQLVVRGCTEKPPDQQWLVDTFMSESTVFLIEKFSTSPSHVARKAVLRFAEQLGQYNHVLMRLCRVGILPLMHELLTASCLNVGERISVLRFLSNFCTVGSPAVEQLCARTNLLSELVYLAESRNEAIAIIEESYFVICNAVVNAAPKELQKMWEERIPDTLVHAEQHCLGHFRPNDIFRAYVKFPNSFLSRLYIFYEEPVTAQKMKSTYKVELISGLYPEFMCEEKKLILEAYAQDAPVTDLPRIAQLSLYDESVDDIMTLESLRLGKRSPN
jgi:hypothetical protein